MSIKAVLFDLDGTLLPMDQDVFVRAYFGGLAKRLAPLGYEPEKLIDAVWKGTVAMIKNDGKATNETVFWNTFAGIFGEKVREDEPHFEEFYKTDFQAVRQVCGFAPQADKTVKFLREKGVRVVLATNPIFPAIATESRIRWAGLEQTDFELYTTYENSRFSKPNPAYYTEILRQLGLSPEECVMVGNDVGDDMVAQSLGLKVFLLTNHLINKTDTDISVFPHGGFAELKEYFESVI